MAAQAMACGGARPRPRSAAREAAGGGRPRPRAAAFGRATAAWEATCGGARRRHGGAGRSRRSVRPRAAALGDAMAARDAACGGARPCHGGAERSRRRRSAVPQRREAAAARGGVGGCPQAFFLEAPDAQSLAKTLVPNLLSASRLCRHDAAAQPDLREESRSTTHK
ncbi:hypothetical protein ACP4OV_007569 [Aristida adscensionis]